MTRLRDARPDDPRRPVIVLSTWPADRDPSTVVVPLVDERLAACVNVLPVMQSVYRWAGEVQRDAEHQLVMKTTADRVPALHARLRELHPYDVPEFLVLDVRAGSQSYLDWLADSATPEEQKS